ncbi:MAG: hypothetical protein AAGF12_26270 [Myxococcota bacterium]
MSQRKPALPSPTVSGAAGKQTTYGLPEETAKKIQEIVAQRGDPEGAAARAKPSTQATPAESSTGSLPQRGVPSKTIRDASPPAAEPATTGVPSKTIRDASPPVTESATTGVPSKTTRDASPPVEPAREGVPSKTIRDASPPVDAPTAPSAPVKKNRQLAGTMLGMPTAVPSADVAPPTAQDPAPANDPASSNDPAPERARLQVEPTKRTMLGVAVVTPDMNVQAPTSPADGGAKKPLPAASNRTMLGMPAKAPDPAAPVGTGTVQGMPQVAPRQRAAVVYKEAEAPAVLPTRRYGLWIGILLVLGVVAGGLAIAASAYLRAETVTIRASVVATDTGDALRIQIPGAAAGSKVRFSGQERGLENGAANFPLEANALSIGDNELSVDVIDEGGNVEQGTVTLTVAYRVRADLSSLSEDPPQVTVVVDAEPGSQVTLDGESLPLENGHGERSYPVASESDEEVVTHEVRYQLTIDGDPVEGVVRTRIPVTSVRIDRPGSELVTDRDVVEIAGAVDPEATVKIDGADVSVNEGRFLHRYPLPENRTYQPRILVRQADRVPSLRTVTVRRVADLRAEAASFEPDPELRYERIEPNPVIYRGQRVAFEGRAYNVDVNHGRSVIQLLVRDCPEGQRCPLWVTYPAATDVTVNSWVRVLGTVAGEQQFRSETNRVISVPRVDALYILPLER